MARLRGGGGEGSEKHKYVVERRSIDDAEVRTRACYATHRSSLPAERSESLLEHNHRAYTTCTLDASATVLQAADPPTPCQIGRSRPAELEAREAAP